MTTKDEQRAEAIKEAREQIAKEVDFVDLKPYSHNIISMTLMILAEKVGNSAANDLIDEFDLESLGWEKQ